MNQYDLNVILNPNLSSEQLETEKSYIENALKNAGAEITESKDVGVQRMAYAINKERDGHYLAYTIKASGNPESSISGSLRLRDHVRRVLLVRDRPEWKTKKTQA